MLCRGSSCLEGGRARGRARARARRPQKPKPAPHPELEGYAGHDATLGKAQRRRMRRLVHSTCPAAQRPAMRAFPFGGSRTAGRCTVQVTLPGTASREGSVLLGVLSAAGLRGYQVPRTRQASAFLPGPADLSDRHQPRAFARGFILPRAFRLLQSPATDDLPSVPRTTSRPPGGQRAPPVGFQFPHRGVSRRRPLVARSSHAPS